MRRGGRAPGLPLVLPESRSGPDGWAPLACALPATEAFELVVSAGDRALCPVPPPAQGHGEAHTDCEALCQLQLRQSAPRPAPRHQQGRVLSTAAQRRPQGCGLGCEARRTWQQRVRAGGPGAAGDTPPLSGERE